ncbi:mitochondrial chaperonin of the DnaJ family [Scheffersomyces amazonensis]|uniref:mitochondrial chaperonin of the DnaJ family n=1 Tax=Scheffersomyces amazonensis TaxID=1078765 RepID=UPI00315D5840
MVLPIIIGVGATVVALTIKSSVAAYSKFLHLTPQMIASLNNIKLIRPDEDNLSIKKSDPNYAHILYLRSRYPASGFKDPMTEQEALLIMGIEGDDIVKFNKKLLRERYRKLIILNHPDKSGSQYISQRINQAKDVLERSYMFKNDKD